MSNKVGPTNHTVENFGFFVHCWTLELNIPVDLTQFKLRFNIFHPGSLCWNIHRLIFTVHRNTERNILKAPEVPRLLLQTVFVLRSSYITLPCITSRFHTWSNCFSQFLSIMNLRYVSCRPPIVLLSLCRLQNQNNKSLMHRTYFNGEWNMKISTKMKVEILPADFLQLPNHRTILSPEHWGLKTY